MTHALFREFIARNTWIFAKTYAAFCPHEYIVKDHLPEEEKVAFEQIVSFIREKGFDAVFGNLGPNQYYTVDDYYYWTMGAPVEQTIILNRAKHSDYDFVAAENGLRVRFRGNKRGFQASKKGENDG